MTKKIEVIIREDRLETVMQALKELGIFGLNVFEVKGHGRQGGVTLAGRAGAYTVDLLPRMQVNIVLSDHNVEKTIDVIREAAWTGEQGDGIIFIYPVDDVVRISSGERGKEALVYEGDIDTREPA